MQRSTTIRRTLRVAAIAIVALGAIAAGGSVAVASANQGSCGPGQWSNQPCRGCPNDPQGPCSPYEDRGRIDTGQNCCDSACVELNSNPYGQYEDYLWIYGWSYHNRVTGRNFQQSYIGGKGGTVGPWTPKGKFHQAVCN